MSPNSKWQLTTNLGRTGDFLECLKFEVEEIDGGLHATRVPRRGGAVRYRFRFEDAATIQNHRDPRYFSYFTPQSGYDNKAIIIAREDLYAELQAYQTRLQEAQRAGQSVLTVSASTVAARAAALQEDADAHGVSVLTFTQFLKTFIDIPALQASSSENIEHLDDLRYVPPRLIVNGQEKTVKDFLDGVLLRKAQAAPFIIVHAPGGRGKTTLAEYITTRVFKRLSHGAPIPFLVKFEKHRGTSELNDLIHQTLRDYGLQYDLDSDAVHRLTQYGVFMLLFDGFDELTAKAGHRFGATNIRQLASKIHKNTGGRALLTCRSTFLTGYATMVDEIRRQAEQETALLVELAEFSVAEVRKYLVRNAPEDTEPEKHRDRVQTFISQQDRIVELAKEPLTLAMISDIVRDYHFRLPDNLAAIYDSFVDKVCRRDAERHDLPNDEQFLTIQRVFLATVAQYMVELGDFVLERSWVAELAQDEVSRYGDEKNTTDELRSEWKESLIDHFMFSPMRQPAAELEANADIRFRHPSFRDFLIASRFHDLLTNGDDHAFVEALEQVEYPDEVLMFLGELLPADAAARLHSLEGSMSRRATRNLVRLLVQWDRGSHFREVLPPPYALRGRPLGGLVFEELDVTGYSWQGTELERTTFENCDLRGCDLGQARWRELRIEGCSLEGADLGEPKGEFRIRIDGEELAGAALETTLRRSGALGPGVRTMPQEPDAEVPVVEIVTGAFRKVVRGHRYADTYVRNALPATFGRGRFLAENQRFVRDEVLPLLQAKGYLLPSGDRRGTITLARERLREVQEFLFDEKVSSDLQRVCDDLAARW